MCQAVYEMLYRAKHRCVQFDIIVIFGIIENKKGVLHHDELE